MNLSAVNKKNAVTDWVALWQRHRGKTALCVCSGPSAAMVSPDGIPHDFSIGANYSYRTHENLDYLVSVDRRVWKDANRPKKIKMLGGYLNDRERKAVLAAGAFCAFPHPGLGWTYYRRGHDLPTSGNSGMAALTLAYYMGARKIIVIGMDFCASGGNIHCYAEPPQKVRQLQNIFQKIMLPRIQIHLLFFLIHCHATGVAVENASPIREQSPLEFDIRKYLEKTGYKGIN